MQPRPYTPAEEPVPVPEAEEAQVEVTTQHDLHDNRPVRDSTPHCSPLTSGTQHWSPHQYQTPQPSATPPTPTSTTLTVMRPQRIRKPNVKYSGSEWDLGPVTHDKQTAPMDIIKIKDMLYFLASRLGYQQGTQP